MTTTKTYGEEQPVYFVIREGGQSPSYRHRSRISASREATRLAGKHPGSTFHVVKLKMTLVSSPADEAPAAMSDTGRQWAAVGRLNVGDRVEISETHHQHPKARGAIIDIKLQGAMPEVRVKLDGEIEPIRFSATSLVVQPEPPRLLPPIGALTASPLRRTPVLDLDRRDPAPSSDIRPGDLRQVIARAIIGEPDPATLPAIISNVAFPRHVKLEHLEALSGAPAASRMLLAPPDSFKPIEERDSIIMTAFVAAKMLRKATTGEGHEGGNYPGYVIEIGTPVFVIANPEILLMQASLEARISRYDPDPHFVWVKPESTAPEMRVDVARVFLWGDTRLSLTLE